MHLEPKVVVMQKYEEFIQLQGSMAHGSIMLNIRYIIYKDIRNMWEHVGHIYFHLLLLFLFS